MGKKITLLENYDNEFVHIKAGTVGMETGRLGWFKFTDIGIRTFSISFMKDRPHIFDIQEIPKKTIALKLEFEGETEGMYITSSFIKKCITTNFHTDSLDNLDITILSTN